MAKLLDDLFKANAKPGEKRAFNGFKTESDLGEGVEHSQFLPRIINERVVEGEVHLIGSKDSQDLVRIIDEITHAIDAALHPDDVAEQVQTIPELTKAHGPASSFIDQIVQHYGLFIRAASRLREKSIPRKCKKDSKNTKFYKQGEFIMNWLVERGYLDQVEDFYRLIALADLLPEKAMGAGAKLIRKYLKKLRGLYPWIDPEELGKAPGLRGID